MIKFIHINERLSGILVEGEPEATVDLIKEFVPDLVDIDTGYSNFIDEGETYDNLRDKLSLHNIPYQFVDRVYTQYRYVDGVEVEGGPIDTVISAHTALTRYKQNAGRKEIG